MNYFSNLMASASQNSYDHYEEYGTLLNVYGTVFGGSILAGIAASKHRERIIYAKGIAVKSVYGVTLASKLRT